jgi:hypothetical protein
MARTAQFERLRQDPVSSGGTQGYDPAEELQPDKAVTVKELCELYFKGFEAGLLRDKDGRPKNGRGCASSPESEQYVEPALSGRHTRR